MKVFTQALTSGSLIISAIDGVLFLSFKTSTDGSCTMSGDGKFQEAESEPMPFGASDGLTLSSQTPTSPLDGITITAETGTVRIIIGTNQ